ncbi:hypothetical protein P3X46_025995 [Hevea brasiliensis]|uniref:NAC domain-containing protein n=1 Tax=Hevea brasiliensis TaxID=3981 RepID=A0ABQ9KWV9_HEVBR|nr:hypothetical protein P3X46_025995 [Hevea brasiliensis]
MEENQNKNINRVSAICISNNHHDDDDNNAYFNSLPVGYRFAPREDVLIIEFLLKKIRNEPLPHNMIHIIKLYKQGPQELTDQGRESEWSFFTIKQRKHKNGSRSNRTAGKGFWKLTGIDKVIPNKKSPLGFRKSLDYYEKMQSNARKTNWKMHEYVLHERVLSAATCSSSEDINQKQDILAQLADDDILAQLTAAEYDNSLMISQQKENSYGSCFPPPALNNFDQNLLPVNTTLNNNFAYNVPPIQSYPPCYSYGLQPIYDQACYDCMEIATMNHHLESAAEEPPFPQPIPASENNSLEFNKQPSTSGPDYTC